MYPAITYFVGEKYVKTTKNVIKFMEIPLLGSINHRIQCGYRYPKSKTFYTGIFSTFPDLFLGEVLQSFLKSSLQLKRKSKTFLHCPTLAFAWKRSCTWLRQPPRVYFPSTGLDATRVSSINPVDSVTSSPVNGKSLKLAAFDGLNLTSPNG